MQIKQIDHAVAHEEESMAEVRERILALTPEGMTPEALLRTDAGGGGGGASAAGSRAGRRSKAKATSVAAAPAPLATSELLAPIAQAVPQHHVPYKFHLPGREPFVVRHAWHATLTRQDGRRHGENHIGLISAAACACTQVGAGVQSALHLSRASLEPAPNRQRHILCRKAFDLVCATCCWEWGAACAGVHRPW